MIHEYGSRITTLAAQTTLIDPDMPVNPDGSGWMLFAIVLILIASMLIFALLVWTFVDILRSDITAGEKGIWIILLFLGGVIGTIAWLIARKIRDDSPESYSAHAGGPTLTLSEPKNPYYK